MPDLRDRGAVGAEFGRILRPPAHADGQYSPTVTVPIWQYGCSCIIRRAQTGEPRDQVIVLFRFTRAFGEYEY
jgi:hypothetical protein